MTFTNREIFYQAVKMRLVKSGIALNELENCGELFSYHQSEKEIEFQGKADGWDSRCSHDR